MPCLYVICNTKNTIKKKYNRSKLGGRDPLAALSFSVVLTQYAAFLYCMSFGVASFLYLQHFVVAFVLCVFGSASFMYLQRLAVAARLPWSAIVVDDSPSM